MAWPLSATCTLPDLWCWGPGVLAGVDRQGAQGWEGKAQLAYPSVICFGRGPEAPGGSETRRRDGSAEAQLWVFVQCRQVPWQELVPFGILAGGWAREMVLASTFSPRQAELCRLGLNNSPSCCPPALPFSEQSCYLITFQMSSPACCQNTLLPAPPLLPARLGGSAWPAGCPSALALSRQSLEGAPPLRPSYPLPCASSLRLAPENPFC